MQNEIVHVLALDKLIGFIKTSTSCNREDAHIYASYYRSIGYRAKTVTESELENEMRVESHIRDLMRHLAMNYA